MAKKYIRKTNRPYAKGHSQSKNHLENRLSVDHIEICRGCDKEFRCLVRGKKYCSDFCKSKKCLADDCENRIPIPTKIRYCSAVCRKKFDKRGGWQGSLPSYGTKTSKMELSLVPKLSKMGYKHTGLGGWWRTWPDGTHHNPDFVNESNRSVFEFFGKYWHSADRGRESYIVDQWRQIGYSCTILWEEDLKKFLEGVSV